MKTEPVAIGAAITSFATAVIALLIGFGVVDWTVEQTGLVLGTLSAGLALVGVIVRGKVTPTANT